MKSIRRRELHSWLGLSQHDAHKSQEGVPPSFDGTLLERYLFAKASFSVLKMTLPTKRPFFGDQASPAAPAFGLDVTELAQHRLQALSGLWQVLSFLISFGQALQPAQAV